MPDLNYPIGKFERPAAATEADRTRWISQIEALPGELREALAGLTEAQLEIPYRPGGWTSRQVVHHVADSHMNSFLRFRLALTEDEPTIKPYDQGAWGELVDTRKAPVEWSLAILEAVHKRWVMLLNSMGEREFERTFRHPELGVLTLNVNLALYAWHGRHHTAHVLGVKKQQG